MERKASSGILKKSFYTWLTRDAKGRAQRTGDRRNRRSEEPSTRAASLPEGLEGSGSLSPFSAPSVCVLRGNASRLLSSRLLFPSLSMSSLLFHLISTVFSSISQFVHLSIYPYVCVHMYLYECVPMCLKEETDDLLDKRTCLL